MTFSADAAVLLLSESSVELLLEERLLYDRQDLRDEDAAVVCMEALGAIDSTGASCLGDASLFFTGDGLGETEGGSGDFVAALVMAEGELTVFFGLFGFVALATAGSPAALLAAQPILACCFVA